MSDYFQPMIRPNPKKQYRKQQHHRRWFLSWQSYLSLTTVILMVWCGAAMAQNSPSEILPTNFQVVVDTIWVLFAGILVFFMNAGFAMLETGLCRSKNAVSLLTKNLIVFGLVTVAYWAFGFGVMFGDGTPWFGSNGFFLEGADNSPLTGSNYSGVFTSLDFAGVPLEAKFFFQLVFAGTAATIVSGAVAERIKFVSFFVFSLFLVSVGYPIIGHWIWGGGVLKDMGFWDFAGSTVVHSVGGWAALVGAYLLGPRAGRYVGGKSIPIPGHNLSFATLGCLILWLGWLGFNAGTTMAANPIAISHILVATNMAAATGAIGGTLTTWLYFGKPDLTMTINGILAGLVSITAGCAFVSIGSAALIGLISGVLIVFMIDLFDRFKIDDPVGALAVHLAGGIWGTLAVGLFSIGPGIYAWYGPGEGPQAGLIVGGGFEQLFIQCIGILMTAVFMLAFSWIVWSGIKATVGIRVDFEAEKTGLDLSEYAMEAYADSLNDEYE